MPRFAVFYSLDAQFELRVPQTVWVRDYTHFGEVEAKDLEDAYCLLQADWWAPEVQAQYETSRPSHPSMCAGDLLVDEDGQAWYCAAHSWERVELH